MNPLESQLVYPFADSLPVPGQKFQVAPDLYWVRKPLPFALDHINLWLLRDTFDGRDGWTLVDTGVGLPPTRELWEQVFASELEGMPIVRVICTHTHPDHLGNAQWITSRFNAPLWMMHGEYTLGRILSAAMPGADGEDIVRHFVSHGLADTEMITQLAMRGSHFGSLVPDMPTTFRRIVAGERIAIGTTERRDHWQIIPGYGHSPEHASLFAENARILISGDMLLPRISTNVSVHAMEPEANPVQQFMDSLRAYLPLPEDTLILPSHGKPFRNLHIRVEQLMQHHRDRLDEVRAMCALQPTTAADVLPVMFKRKLDAHQIFFALGEALAHLHALWYTGEVKRERGADGVYRFSPA